MIGENQTQLALFLLPNRRDIIKKIRATYSAEVKNLFLRSIICLLLEIIVGLITVSKPT